MNLDPAAVEAAVKAMCDEWEKTYGSDTPAEARAAITAYQRHQAAAVREAVDRYREACEGYGYNDGCYGAEEVKATEAALLALFGAQEDAE